MLFDQRIHNLLIDEIFDHRKRGSKGKQTARVRQDCLATVFCCVHPKIGTIKALWAFLLVKMIG